MKQNQLTTHLQKSNKITRRIKCLIAGTLIGSLFFFQNDLNAKVPNPTAIKIAILDTGFCPSKLNSKKDYIKILPIIDVTGNAVYDCEKMKPKNRRFHGQMVLAQFLNVYSWTNPVEILPITIFDKSGSQRLSYWKKAIIEAQSQKVDFILAAAGLPIPQGMQPKGLIAPSAITFLSSGRIGPGITKATTLFPQMFHKNKNIFLIGSYHPPESKHGDDFLSDENQLYKKGTDYYLSGGNSHHILRSSSRSATTALAKAIGLCKTVKLQKLRECLSKNKKEIKVINSNRILPTF